MAPTNPRSATPLASHGEALHLPMLHFFLAAAAEAVLLRLPDLPKVPLEVRCAFHKEMSQATVKYTLKTSENVFSGCL
jgi:hypothetical protein